VRSDQCLIQLQQDCWRLIWDRPTNHSENSTSFTISLTALGAGLQIIGNQHSKIFLFVYHTQFLVAHNYSSQTSCSACRGASPCTSLYWRPFATYQTIPLGCASVVELHPYHCHYSLCRKVLSHQQTSIARLPSVDIFERVGFMCH